MRENHADTHAGGIRCYVEQFGKIWESKDRGGGQGDLELLEGTFGGWTPFELGLPEYVGQLRGERTEIADESPIKLSQAVETPYVEDGLGCWPVSKGCCFDGINGDPGRRDDESQK